VQLAIFPLAWGFKNIRRRFYRGQVGTHVLLPRTASLPLRKSVQKRRKKVQFGSKLRNRPSSAPALACEDAPEGVGAPISIALGSCKKKGAPAFRESALHKD
jgi:hypothetical protein